MSPADSAELVVRWQDLFHLWLSAGEGGEGDVKGSRWDSREMRSSAQNEQRQSLSKAVSEARHFLMGFRDRGD